MRASLPISLSKRGSRRSMLPKVGYSFFFSSPGARAPRKTANAASKTADTIGEALMTAGHLRDIEDRKAAQGRSPVPGLSAYERRDATQGPRPDYPGKLRKLRA